MGTAGPSNNDGHLTVQMDMCIYHVVHLNLVNYTHQLHKAVKTSTHLFLIINFIK